jgi:hypothetical protein
MHCLERTAMIPLVNCTIFIVNASVWTRCATISAHLHSGAWEEWVQEICNTYAGWFWEGGWSVEVVEGVFSFCLFVSSLLIAGLAGPWVRLSDHLLHGTWFLGIPGASVSVKRLFSKSRHLCTDLWGSLHAATITEAMCARQWLSEGLFKLNWAYASGLGMYLQFFNNGLSYIIYKQFKWLSFTVSL